MKSISQYIEEKNIKGEKVLSVFLTAGFPDRDNFTELALKILSTGADMLEIGFPFSDPLADGPIIQHSSQTALDNGIDLKASLKFLKEIRQETDKPLILMGYANPVLSYGISLFAFDALSYGANGVIIPDVPIEEYDNFFDSSYKGLDKILLVTPTTPDNRIKIIDEKSSGFIYCVSVSGTTGTHHQNDKSSSIEFIKRTRNSVRRNKTLVGFGISSPEDAKLFAPHCDGIIVGSAVIKSLMNDDSKFGNTLSLVSKIKEVL